MLRYLAVQDSVVARNNRTHQLQIELNELTSDFRDYRDQVTHHFMRTSELVQEMTHSYRSVYEHLASGAQHLCSDNEAASLHHAAAGTPANVLAMLSLTNRGTSSGQ